VRSIAEAPRAVAEAMAHDGPVVVDVITAVEHISPAATISSLRG
jgi:thiamine pyrophosphate-dependent acetolactate synthase large subunit-like protein